MKPTALGEFVVLVAEDEKKKAPSLIHIPDMAKSLPEIGVVVNVGEGILTSSGTRVALGVKEGDKVLFKKFNASSIRVEQVEYYLVRYQDILCTL